MDAGKQAGTERERLGIAAIVTGLIVASGFFWAGGCGVGRAKGKETARAAPATFRARAAVPARHATPTAPPHPASTEIVVYVTGAVKRPGVYTLAATARIYHAIRAAGGFKANAVTDALNLADPVLDGDHLCVLSRAAATKSAAAPPSAAPRTVPALPASLPLAAIIRKSALPPAREAFPAAPVILSLPPSAEDAEPLAPSVAVMAPVRAPGRVIGVPSVVVAAAPPAEQPAATAPDAEEAAAPDALAPAVVAFAPPAKVGGRHKGGAMRSGAGHAQKFKNPGDGIVHINSAGAAEFEKLNRCGPAMSAKILAYRAQVGKFTDVRQLMDVKGVGDKTFEKWAPFLAL